MALFYEYPMIGEVLKRFILVPFFVISIEIRFVDVYISCVDSVIEKGFGY